MLVPDILKPPIFSFEPPALNEPWPNYLYWDSLAEAFCQMEPPMIYHAPLPNIPLRDLVRRAFQILNTSGKQGFIDLQKEALPLVLTRLLAWVEGPLFIDGFRSNEAARNEFLKNMFIVLEGDRKVRILSANKLYQVDQSPVIPLYRLSQLGKLPVNSSEKWLFLPINLAQRFNILPSSDKVPAIQESFKRLASQRGFVEPMDLLPLDELALEKVAYLLWLVLLGFNEKEKQRIEELIRKYSRLPLYHSYPPNLDYSSSQFI